MAFLHQEVCEKNSSKWPQVLGVEEFGEEQKDYELGSMTG